MTNHATKPSSRRSFLRGSAGVEMGVTAASTGLLAGINQGRAAEGEPIPVGQGTMLSGWGAADGLEFKNGLEMAAEEINAMGGILGVAGWERGTAPIPCEREML